MSSNTANSDATPSPSWWRRCLPFCRRLAVGVLVLYWLVLFTLTHLPAGSGSGKVNDKVAHFVAYALLAFLLVWATRPRAKLWWSSLSIIGLCAFYGMLDELLQGLIPSRTADFWDWLADLLGAAAGTLAGVALLLVWRRLTRIGKSDRGVGSTGVHS